MSQIDGPYSPYKVVHHAGKIEAIKRGEHPAPAQVQLIISDLCNQDCSFCSYRVSGNTSNQLFNDGENHNPNRKIPYENVLEILDDCVEMGVKAIQLTGGGEPSVHPQFTEIMRAVLERGLELAVVSNGVRWKDEDIELLAKAAWVRVSLDAGHSATYAALRRVPKEHFFKAIANIKRLAESSRRCVLGVGFVVTQDNWKEIVVACRLARDLGVDNFRISAAFLPGDAAYHDPHHAQAAEIAKDALDLDGGKFTVFNLYSDRIEDLEQGQPDYDKCLYQHLVTYIGGDQSIYRCCNTAYNKQGYIGDLLGGGRFKDEWQTAQRRMTDFNARSCDRCQFNRQNRIANYMLADDPEHVAFV